jgi:hypothetical protein
VPGDKASLDSGGPKLRVLIPIVVGVVVAALVAIPMVRRYSRSRRTADATPGLHQHPERLDQMLDPTDDA